MTQQSKNDHLVPDLVRDLADKLQKASPTEKFMIEARLAAIRDFCDSKLKTSKIKN